jgi:bidirectional [NiFe] hydrogenase diaphorase subunit
MISLTIDGKEVQVPEGATVLDAAEKLGIEIPTLCHFKGLTPYGACRVCTVEISTGNGYRLQSSCSYPVQEGLRVRTDTKRVKEGRRLIVELLLARCPEVKAIRELAEKVGVKETRFRLKNEDCILCGLCVVVCNEVVGAGALGFSERGITRKVGTPYDEESDVCIGCGACTYVCPTGAIQMEQQARERFRRLSGPERLCRYARMGMFAHKICPNSFECFRCEVDQRMEDTFGTHPALAIRPAGAKQAEKIQEFTLRPDVLYHPGHVWARPLNGKVMLGLDDFAQQLVGNVKDISLLPAGKSVNPGDMAWELTCGEDKQAKMLFPFGGRIADVNPDVMNDPSLVRKDSYSRGWIYLMAPGEDDYQADLLSRYNAKEWLISEANRLHEMMEGKAGLIITDGGHLLEDLPDKLSEQEWNNLVGEFFLRHI